MARSAEDMIDGGVLTTDEEDMMMVGDLLSDELPEPAERTPAAPTVLPDEDDEFESLMEEEDELSAPEETLVTTATDMAADLEESDDEFSGLDVPAARPAPAEVLAEAEGSDPPDDLTPTELDDPFAEPVEAGSEEIGSLEAPEEIEPTAENESSTEEGLSPAQIRGRKAAQTRRQNREKAGSENAETEPALEDNTDESTFEDIDPGPVETAHRESLRFTTPVRPPNTPTDSFVHDDQSESAIERALKQEAQQYADVSDRDLYFYRLGVSEGMKKTRDAKFVETPC